MDYVIAKIKRLSNLDYCQSAEDMQNYLEEIQDLLNDRFPEVDEEDEEED
jgi:hypothetical protein